MAVILSKQLKIPFPAPSSHTPGDVITWDDKEWLVCHYNSTNKQVYLIAKDIISMTNFNNSRTANVYLNSILASVAISYQNNQISSNALEMIVDTTVNSVTAKVFVPSYEQMNGSFSWFNSDSRRIAQYQGSNTTYWTSSPQGNGVWSVNTAGTIVKESYCTTSLGFRPCICVQL